MFIQVWQTTRRTWSFRVDNSDGVILARGNSHSTLAEALEALTKAERGLSV